MKFVLSLTLLICLCGLISQAQSHMYGLEGTKPPEDSTSSVLHGLYGTYPIMSKSKIQKMEQRSEQIERSLAHLDTLKKQSLDNLTALTEADTIPIRKHMKFLGGRYTYPKITNREKKGLEIRKKIASEREHIASLEEKIAKLKEDRKEIEALKKKHDQYLEKRILWGFIVWEVEKKGER